MVMRCLSWWCGKLTRSVFLDTKSRSEKRVYTLGMWCMREHARMMFSVQYCLLNTSYAQFSTRNVGMRAGRGGGAFFLLPCTVLGRFFKHKQILEKHACKNFDNCFYFYGLKRNIALATARGVCT